jgi:hypothetical protein
MMPTQADSKDGNRPARTGAQLYVVRAAGKRQRIEHDARGDTYELPLCLKRNRSII